MLKIANLISGGLLFIGILIGYVLLFGDNIFYTKTYSFAYEVGMPAINFEFLVFTGMIIFQLMVFVFFPQYGKIKLIDALVKYKRIRLAIKISTSVLLLFSLFLFLFSIIKKDWSIFNDGFFLTTYTFFGGILLYFLYYSISPKATALGLNLIKPTGRIFCFVAVVVLIVFWLSAIEVVLKGGHERQKFDSKIQFDKSTKYSRDISIIFADIPDKIKSGESKLVDVRFRLTEHDPGAAGRYPILIDTSVDYIVKASIKSMGFEVLETEGYKTYSKVELNKQLSWKWFISPKENKADTKQLILFEILLLRAKDSAIVFSNPVTTISINISTPLGLPQWIITPGFSICALIAGLLGLIVPIFQEDIRNLGKKIFSK